MFKTKNNKYLLLVYSKDEKNQRGLTWSWGGAINERKKLNLTSRKTFAQQQYWHFLIGPPALPLIYIQLISHFCPILFFLLWTKSAIHFNLFSLSQLWKWKHKNNVVVVAGSIDMASCSPKDEEGADQQHQHQHQDPEQQQSQPQPQPQAQLPQVQDCIHKTKAIQFLGRTTPIVLQNDNGPCPLLAICQCISHPRVSPSPQSLFSVPHTKLIWLLNCSHRISIAPPQLFIYSLLDCLCVRDNGILWPLTWPISIIVACWLHLIQFLCYLLMFDGIEHYMTS